jgi:hypothetical protein
MQALGCAVDVLPVGLVPVELLDAVGDTAGALSNYTVLVDE